MGSEPLVVAQSAILARWFRGKELALSFGIALTVSRLGTLFTFNTEALDRRAVRLAHRALGRRRRSAAPASSSPTSLYNVLDKKAEPRTRPRGETGPATRSTGRSCGAAAFPPSFWYVTLLCVTFYSAIFPFTALSTDFFHHKWGLPEAQRRAAPASSRRSSTTSRTCSRRRRARPRSSSPPRCSSHRSPGAWSIASDGAPRS